MAGTDDSLVTSLDPMHVSFSDADLLRIGSLPGGEIACESHPRALSLVLQCKSNMSTFLVSFPYLPASLGGLQALVEESAFAMGMYVSGMLLSVG